MKHQRRSYGVGLLLTMAALLLESPHGIYQSWGATPYSNSQINSVESDDERQLNQIRDQEITQLKIVLGRRQVQNRRPDVLLRLAEIYVEKYRHYFLKENEIHQRLIKAGQNPRYVDHTRSNSFLQSATNACLAIIKSKVSFGKMDQVYYFLGYNAGEMGHRDESLRYFRVVVDRYPQSTYIAEAERNLAEGAFEKQKYRESVQWYERAIRHKNISSYPRLLYKLSWSYFKVKRYADALEAMKRVVKLSGEDSKFVGLREEALHDLVSFYVEAGRYRDAREYFEEINGGAELYVQALKGLSNVYERAGRFSQAVFVNNELISQYQESKPELTIDVLAHNVEILRKVGDGPNEEKALKRLVDFFIKHGPGIRKNSEEAQLAWDRTKKYLRTRATEVHKEAQKKKTPALFARAADLYNLYAKAFLLEDDSDGARRELSEVRIYRSDALLQISREPEAMVELEATLRDRDGNPKFRKEAGQTLLNLLLKRIDQSLKNKTVDAVVESKFIDCSEYFADQFPEDSIVPELRYKQARLKAARKSDPEDAQEALDELVAKYPQRPESIDAAHDLVFAQMKAGKIDAAVDRSKKYLANETLMRADKKGELRQFLDSVLARKSFSDVQGLEKSNDYEKAAKGFEQLASTSRDPEVVKKSFNNAAVNYEKAQQFADAIRIYEQLLRASKSKADQDTYRKNLKAVASRYLWSSDFANAGDLFARFSKNAYFSREEREDFASIAIQLFWGLENRSKALQWGRESLSGLCQNGSSPFCVKTMFDMAALMQEQGQLQESVDLMKGYLAHLPPAHSRAKASKSKKSKKTHLPVVGGRFAEANFILATIYRKSADENKATLYFQEASRASSGDRREVNYAAHAAFLLVEPLYQRFMGLKLEQPEALLKTRTKEKLGMLESLSTRYENVVSYGDGEWGIAALERLGNAFLSFSNDLQQTPPPSSLDAAQQEQYRRSIMTIAGPLSDRGFEFLNKAYKTGINLHIFSPVFIKITQSLSRKLPKQFPPAHYSLDEGSNGESRGTNKLRLMGGVQSLSSSQMLEQNNPWRKELAAKLATNPKSAETWIDFGNCEALSGRSRIAQLLYEQALSINPRSLGAINNLAVLSFLDGQSVQGGQGLLKAVELSEFAKEPRLNLVKAMVGYHHFKPAFEHARTLSARNPDDREVREVFAVSQLGNGEFNGLQSKWDELNAKSSKSFSLWYNWSVWAILSGDHDLQEDGMAHLKDKLDDSASGSVEREMISLSIDVLQSFIKK